MTVILESALPPARRTIDVPRFCATGLYEQYHHLLLWVAHGRARFTVDGTGFVLHAGQALWIPARTSHSFTVTKNSALLPIFFDADDIPLAMSSARVVAVDGHVEAVCFAVVGSQYSLVQPAIDLRSTLLSLLEAQAAMPESVVMPTSLAPLRIARHVVLDPAGQLTLADWAAELCVSTRTLERMFTAETGMGFRQWRHAIRMTRAAALLVGSGLPVIDIAQQVGFSTHSALTRAFRGFYGVTPSTFRADAIGG